MTSPGSSVPYINPENIEQCARAMEPDLRDRLGDAFTRDHLKIAAASRVFATLFGPEWMSAKMGKDPFIQPPLEDRMDYYKTADRITGLAEALMNLQAVPGFELILDEVRKDSVESSLGKLYAAGMLRRFRIQFRFVAPSGKVGHDYDAEATIAGRRVPIEMKTKVEGKEPSVKSIANTLSGSHKQFPGDTPNVLFMRVPGPWGESHEGRSAILEAIGEEFRASGCLALVFVHFEKWRVSADGSGGVERTDERRAFPSGVSRAGLDGLEAIYAPKISASELQWVYFDWLFLA